MGVAQPSVTYVWRCTHRRIDRRMREARDGRMNGWRERRRDRETDREVGGTLFVDQRTRSCDALQMAKDAAAEEEEKYGKKRIRGIGHRSRRRSKKRMRGYSASDTGRTTSPQTTMLVGGIGMKE